MEPSPALGWAVAVPACTARAAASASTASAPPPPTPRARAGAARGRAQAHSCWCLLFRIARPPPIYWPTRSGSGNPPASMAPTGLPRGGPAGPGLQQRAHLRACRRRLLPVPPSSAMPSSSLQSRRVMVWQRTGRTADRTAMGSMRPSPYQVTTSSGGCVRHPAHPGRRIVGRARSRSIPESDRGGWAPPQYPRS